MAIIARIDDTVTGGWKNVDFERRLRILATLYGTVLKLMPGA
jgi:hypothetical protein